MSIVHTFSETNVDTVKSRLFCRLLVDLKKSDHASKLSHNSQQVQDNLKISTNHLIMSDLTIKCLILNLIVYVPTYNMKLLKFPST